MKLHIVSDLHLEKSQIELPSVEADILVLAGDIGVGTEGISFAKRYQKKYKHILYVMGNHEFYGHHLSKMAKEIKQNALGTNIHVLDNDVFEFQEHVFIGSTLWADFKLYGDDLKIIQACMNEAGKGITDFSIIRYGNFYFNPSNCAQMALINQQFLKQRLEHYATGKYKNYKQIVITHHCPSLKSVPKKYEGMLINAYFSNPLDELVQKSNLWIHGHTHTSFDYRIGNDLEKGRVICNPRGYSKYQDKQENAEFKLDLVVEI